MCVRHSGNQLVRGAVGDLALNTSPTLPPPIPIPIPPSFWVSRRRPGRRMGGATGIKKLGFRRRPPGGRHRWSLSFLPSRHFPSESAMPKGLDSLCLVLVVWAAFLGDLGFHGGSVLSETGFTPSTGSRRGSLFFLAAGTGRSPLSEVSQTSPLACNESHVKRTWAGDDTLH